MKPAETVASVYRAQHNERARFGWIGIGRAATIGRRDNHEDELCG
jgi:hypothetical protein